MPATTTLQNKAIKQQYIAAALSDVTIHVGQPASAYFLGSGSWLGRLSSYSSRMRSSWTIWCWLGPLPGHNAVSASSCKNTLTANKTSLGLSVLVCGGNIIAMLTLLLITLFKPMPQGLRHQEQQFDVVAW